ncbi:MAG: hypothetical protein WC998_00635 [Candidatus Paceibacterota bacterium]|jgi:hypothetical protein
MCGRSVHLVSPRTPEEEEELTKLCEKLFGTEAQHIPVSTQGEDEGMEENNWRLGKK